MHSAILRLGTGSYSKGKVQTWLQKGSNKYLDFLKTTTSYVQK